MKAQRIRQAISLLCLSSLVLLLVAGFGCSGKKSVEISGKVTYKGAPVTGGQITFEPASGSGTAGKGSIDAKGNYKVSGAPVGDVKVVVDTENVKGMPGMPPPTDASMAGKEKFKDKEKDKGAERPDFSGMMPKYVAIPPKYRSKATTTLTYTVKGSAKDVNFDLQD